MMKRFLKFILIFLLLFSWIFSGWPVIWQNPRIPPEIQKALAAQATIDATVSTASARHNGGSPTTVFISQTTGYAFYVDSTGYCAYSKTTDGGATWGAAVNVFTTNTACLQIAVWYDRWTPGDTTGTLIHIAVIDSTNDDIFYRYLDTSNDTLSTGPVNITSGLGYAGTLSAGTNHVALTKGTDGALYAAVSDGADNMAVRCTTTCTTATNWAVSEPASWSVGNDFQILVPMLSGNILFLWWDISVTTNDIKYSRWNGTSWSAWANIDTALENGTYDASWGAAVDPSTGNVYLAHAASANTLGTDDDIRVKRFNASGGTWTTLTDVVTNSVCAGVSNCGITGAKIARDNTTGYLYVLYSAQSTPGTASTGNVYFKVSTDGGSTWSSEFGPVYSTNDDIYGARLSLSDSSGILRIYATWYAATPDDLFGRPIAPLTFNQSAYRLFNNNDSTDVGTPLAAQDTAATLGSTGAAFRLRMLLHVGVSDLFANEQSFKLQFAQRGADNLCDTSFSGETYSDVTTSTVIAFNDNPTPADGATLTANANDPTHGADTIVNQTYEELNNFTNSVAAIPSGQDGKWDFSLKDNGASPSTTYCFRIVKSDGSLLDTYTVIPQITTVISTIFSGTVYQTDESTPLSNALSIKLAVGSSTVFSTTTDTNGNFSFSGPGAVASGTVITIWLDTNAATSASLVFKYGSFCNGYPDCTGLSLYQNRVNIDNKYGGNITNADLANCDNNSGSVCSDTDIGFTSDSGVLTLTFSTNMLRIASGVTFAPGGNVNAQKLRVAGTYSGGSETLTLSGSGTGTTCGLADQMPLCVDGTYTASNNTTKFTGTSSTNIALNSNFYNLELSPAATVTYTLGTTSGQTLTVNGNLNIGDGTNALTVAANTNNPNISVTGNTTINNNATLTIGSGTQNLAGNLTVSGLLNGSGNITVNGSVGGTGTINLTGGTFEQRTASAQNFGTTSGSNQWTFYNLKFSASTASTITFNSGGTGYTNVTNILTVGGTSSPTSTVNFANRTIYLSASGTPFEVTSYGIFQSASSTFVFSGNSQTVAPQTYYNLTLSGSGTPVLTGLTTINNNFLLSGTVNPSTVANLTIGGNLQINNSNTLTVPSSYTLSVSGTTLIDGTLNLSSTAASGHSFNGDVTIGTTGVWNNSGNAIVSFGGSLTNNNTFTTGTGTQTFTGTSKTISGTVSIPHLTISGTIQNNGTLTVSNALSGSGTLTQGNGSTLYLSGTVSITNLDASTNSNTVVYNGSSLQTIKAITYSNLTLDNSAGANITGDITINGTLTLTNGKITTGNNSVIISSSGNVSRTNGYIVGNLKKYIGTGNTSKTFEIGDANIYAPIDVSFSNVTAGGYLTANTTSGDHPDISNSGIDPTKSVNRYWTMTNSGIVFDNYSATFYFNSSDIDSGANWNNFIVAKKDANWTLPTVGTKTATSTQATGMTSFSDYQVGEALPVSITLTIVPSNVNLGTLIPGVPVVATSTATVSATNASLGYNLQIKRDSATSTLSYTTITFPDYTSWDPTANGGSGNATTTPGETFSFRVNYTGTTSNYNSTWWGANDNDGTAKYGGMPATSQQIMTCSSSSCQNGTTDTVIKYRADAPATQPIGDYSGTITVTALPNL